MEPFGVPAGAGSEATVILRIFTPSEARRALPQVRPAVCRMRRAYRGLQALSQRQRPDESPVDPDYFRQLAEFQDALRAVVELGLEVRDYGRGLVDFPARRAGRLVYLCWHADEDDVRFWHEQDGGYAGRQPVDEHGPWEAGNRTGPDLG